MADNEAEQALAAFEKAYDDYEAAYKAALITNGTKAFIQGDLRAQKALDLKLKFDLVNKEALKYIKAYKKELDKGGSTIQGEFVPWLENKSKEERAAISKIIEEGYKAGKPTGVKQRIPGGAYPKNSIAYDLQEYFNSRKSHAATVARTEIARIQHHGSMTRYQKQGVSKIIWLVFNPCPICSQYARRVYEVDKLPREIPVHPNCRCAAAPVPDEVPTGPAPDQKIPEVFEREAKALPPIKEKWEVKKSILGQRNIPYESTTSHLKTYDMKIINKEFNQEEADALHYYVGSGYTRLNNMYRMEPEKFIKWLADWDFSYTDNPGGPKAQALKYMEETLKPRAKAVTAALDRSTINEEFILYRAPGRTGAKGLLEDGEVIDPAFLSSSSRFEMANGAFGRPDETGYTNIIVFRGKPGDKALYINEVESEILYQKGQHIKLLGIEEVDHLKMVDTAGTTRNTAGKIRLLYCKLI